MSLKSIRILPGHIALAARIMRRCALGVWVIAIILLGRNTTSMWLETETARATLISAVREVQVDSPSSHQVASSSKGETIIRGLREKKIFGELGRLAAPVAAPTPAITRAPMALKLVGTYVANSVTDSYAIIEQTKKNEQDVFAVTDSVFDEARLVSIEIDRVFLDRDGSRVELNLNEGSTDAGGGGADGVSQVFVAEAEVDEALSNLPVLLTQLRAVPYFKNGQAVGLRLFAIKSGSLFEKIGLKNGDILQTINGNQLGDFSQALKLFEQLKSERSLRLVLERNREAVTYNYVIR